MQPSAAEYALLFRQCQEQQFAARALLEQAGATHQRVYLLFDGVARLRVVQAGRDHSVGLASSPSCSVPKASIPSGPASGRAYSLLLRSQFWHFVYQVVSRY